MIKKILIHAYLQIINNGKLTKLILFTLFAHSFIFVLTILYNVYFYVENEFTLNTSSEVINYIFNLLNFDNIGITAVIVGIVLFLGYFVIGPIGECAIVHYLHHKHKLSQSLAFGFSNFHHIAQFEGMTFVFNIVMFLNILSKVYIYEMDNSFVLSLMFLWLLMVVFVTFFLQYTKTIILIEEIPVFDAIKKSMRLSVENIWTTVKLVGISLIFSMRLIFNILFIVWIPLAAIFLLQIFNIVGAFADGLVYFIFFSLVLFLAYVNTLIEWYFRVFWYISYQYIMGNEDELHKLGLYQQSGGLFDDQDLQHAQESDFH
jgi:hypothetical protein